MDQKIIFVDTMAYIFRNFHATYKQGLTNRDGFPTGAIYGFYNAIKNLEKRIPGSKIVFITDMPGPTFRNRIYAEYKANRKPAPEDLKIQIDPIYELINIMDFPLLRVNDVEADDIIASAVGISESKGMDAVVASGDKDLMSLVSKNTTILDTKWQILEIGDVTLKMGVEPKYIHLLLSIMGDAADNIPGLRGAGPKTAINWIKQYPTLTDLKNNTDKIKGKIGDNIRENFKDIELSYELVELKTDVEIEDTIFDLSIKPKFNESDLDSFLSKYEIKK